MAQTLSTMLPLGTPAPGFALPDAVSGKIVSPADFKSAPALVVMFLWLDGLKTADDAVGLYGLSLTAALFAGIVGTITLN